MAFNNILGNERQKKILKRALEKGRLPNSLLFCGDEGIGKRSLAVELAKALNCLRKKDDACDVCRSCKTIERASFPDVMIISPEKNVIKINRMRILKQTAYLKPMIGKKRVFIVDEAEKMNEEAANSLLKILEEPPLFSHIILVTSNPEIIKPTIMSRCQVLSFQPIEREDIEKVLIDRGVEKDRAKILSLLVRGNLKKALEVEWEEIQVQRERAWDVLRSLTEKGKIAAFLQNFSSARGQEKEELEQILEILSSYCRDLILIREGGDLRLMMNPDYEEKLKKAVSHFSLEKSMECLENMDYALYGLQRNLNLNLLLSSLFSNIMV